MEFWFMFFGLCFISVAGFILLIRTY